MCRWRRGDEEVAGEGMEEEEEEEAGEGMGQGWGRSGRRAAEGHWESEDTLGSTGGNWERWERTGVALRGTRNYNNFTITSCTILTIILLPTWKYGLHSGAANIWKKFGNFATQKCKPRV